MAGWIQTHRDRFARQEDGNFAVVLAVSVGLMSMAVGAAIDFNNANRAKGQLQAAIDAGVLAAAMDPDMRDRTQGGSGIAKSTIEAVAAANLPDGFDFKVKVEVKDDTIYAVAESDQETSLMKIIGWDELGISVDAASPIPDDIPLHIALVVDTTASMDGANMTALKSAGTALLNDIEDFSDNAKVSLVPYGQYVNIGTEHEFATWLDTSRRLETKHHSREAGCRDDREVLEPRTCTPTGGTRQEPIWNDGTITGYRTVNEQSCTSTVYGGVTGQTCWDAATWTTTVNFTFTGCAGSRPSPKNLEPTASATNKIRAAMQPDNAAWKARCGEPLTPLTNNFSTLRNSLNGLTTEGDTYLPAGLMWGWRTLDPGVPFTQAAGSDPKTVNAIILMTDGGNTKNQNGETSSDPGYHYDGGNLGAAGRSHFDQLCDAVKGDDIIVFTIGYNLDSSFPAHTESVASLRACATSTGHAYTPDNVNELKDTFKAVMLSLRDIRLSI